MTDPNPPLGHGRTAFIDDVTAVVTTPDGRRPAYLEVGDPKAPLVLHNHGKPSSRLQVHLLADAAMKNGLRLPCVDRPAVRRVDGAGHFLAIGAGDGTFGIAAKEMRAS